MREGDLIRCVSGMKMGMSYPSWQLILGGVGRPTCKGARAHVGHALDVVMAAIGSNSVQQQGDGQAILLLERPSKRNNNI